MNEQARDELTFGQKACGCGANFDFDGDQTLETIRQSLAQLIDIFDSLRRKADNNEVARMLSLAITDAQTSQMWAVKAITWSHQ
tara:strand:+ start:469 stop:720 length:252 start_codon:yes stop_codon:yes gene_type:complete